MNCGLSHNVAAEAATAVPSGEAGAAAAAAAETTDDHVSVVYEVEGESIPLHIT